MLLVGRNLRPLMEFLWFGGRVGSRERLYLLSSACSTTSNQTRPPGRLGSYWMRESAHRADSAMTFPGGFREFPHQCRNSYMFRRSAPHLAVAQRDTSASRGA